MDSRAQGHPAGMTNWVYVPIVMPAQAGIHTPTTMFPFVRVRNDVYSNPTFELSPSAILYAFGLMGL